MCFLVVFLPREDGTVLYEDYQGKNKKRKRKERALSVCHLLPVLYVNMDRNMLGVVNEDQEVNSATDKLA